METILQTPKHAHILKEKTERERQKPSISSYHYVGMELEMEPPHHNQKVEEEGILQ